MGASPKTKADCDKAILTAQKDVNNKKAYLAQMKAWYGPGPAVNNAKVTLANAQGELARLKALRKTLK